MNIHREFCFYQVNRYGEVVVSVVVSPAPVAPVLVPPVPVPPVAVPACGCDVTRLGAGGTLIVTLVFVEVRGVPAAPEVPPEGAGTTRSRVTVVCVSRSITRVAGAAGAARSMTTGAGGLAGTGTTSVLSTRSTGGVITVVVVGSARVSRVEK
jgi:hypothetical protein